MSGRKYCLFLYIDFYMNDIFVSASNECVLFFNFNMGTFCFLTGLFDNSVWQKVQTNVQYMAK